MARGEIDAIAQDVEKMKQANKRGESKDKKNAVTRIRTWVITATT